MGVFSKSIGLYYAYRILRILSQRWEDTPAFKAGIIDAHGKKIVDKLTSEQKNDYQPFYRIIYNIKRVISLVPGSQNPFVRYASALALLKEEEMTDEKLEAFLLDFEKDLDEETPVVTVGSGAIDLTPTMKKKKKSLKEALDQKRVSNSSQIV